LYSA
jgi:hypothetical protein